MNEENGLPRGWVQTTLGDVSHWSGGGTPSKDREQFWVGGNIPWVSPKDMKTLRIIDTEDHLSITALEETSLKLYPAGTVLVVVRSGILQRTLPVAVSQVPVTINQDLKGIYFEDSIDPMYIAYYLISSEHDILSRCSKDGTTVASIKSESLKTYPMPLAPIPEQQRIVAAIEQQFSRLDAGIAALRRARAKLKRYRASVLKAAVEGKLTETWRAEHPTIEPASQLQERILTERRAKWETDLKAKGKDPAKVKYVEPAKPETEGLPGLPEGWCWARAEQLCDFITKGTTPIAEKLYSGTGEIPFIKVYNLTNYGFLDFSVNPTFVSKQTHSQELARSKVIPGDVLMNIVGPPLGKVSIVPDLYCEWNINQAIVVFRPMLSYDRKFLCFSLLTDQILSWAKLRAKATAGQFNLTLEICRDLPIPLPPLIEQEQIVAEVERRLSVVSQLESTVEANLKRAERLRQSILKEAFAGRLVPQDPDDEPASVLLERIRSDRENRKHKAPDKGREVICEIPKPKKIDVSRTKQVELWESISSGE